ncbi:MAG TPA: hypothetical protein EYQ14_30185 [Gammaproteobacteria bacterium]|nr:hypothetical protein [Gammaproteobacteria bacterium]HIK70966.1 hypothetical protein [Pseudomonadales bacterium]
MTAARMEDQVGCEQKRRGGRYAVVTLCGATDEDPAGLSAAY